MLSRRNSTIPPVKVVEKLNVFGGNKAGLALIETLVALAILGIIAAAFLGGLATASKATFIADEGTTAQSLAQSQMEYAKTLDYVYSATEYPPAPIPGGEDYADYSATIDAEPLHDPDQGLQKITVTIEHQGKQVITLESYKVDQ